jgi:hypothetical protein
MGGLIGEIFFNLLQPGIETIGRGVLKLFGSKDTSQHTDLAAALVGATFLTAIIVFAVLFFLWIFAKPSATQR